MKNKIKNNIIEDDISISGLFECKVAHEVKKSSGTILWTGPKIPPEVWKEILSFFKWTYDTTKSESQVRLYVSPVHNTWKAWAFPQEAKTGMTARELDNDDAKKQRAELNMNPPEWFYFGTVHHHCGCSAFQSGTDADNEKDQDGLHITIGKMDEAKFDLHARFYRRGLMFEPKMNWFWDVSEVLNQCPKAFRDLLPKDLEDKTARTMMCQPPEALDFPQQWEDNLIEIKPPPVTHITYPGGTSQFPGLSTGVIPSHWSPDTDPLWKRSKKAWEEIIFECAKHEVFHEDLKTALDEIGLVGFAYHIIVMACRHHKVDPDDISREQPNQLEQAIAEESVRQGIEIEKEIKAENAEAGKGATPPPGNEPGGDVWPESYIS